MPLTNEGNPANGATSDCRDRHISPSWAVSFQRLTCAYMKTINHASKEHRSFRRSVRKFFDSWLKRQNCSCQAETQTIIAMLQEIEASIEIIAREMARQIKQNGQ